MTGRIRRIASVLALAMVVAGCAAIRIDVDVYKGPLANHPDVQVRQYAALAMAARPVLASLRNRLEDQKSPYFSRNLAPSLREAWLQHWDFKDETARFINGALSFYEDSGDKGLSRHAELAKVSFEAFAAERRVLDGEGEVDGRLAEELLRRYPLKDKSKESYKKHEWEFHRWRFGYVHALFLQGAQSLPTDMAHPCRDDKTASARTAESRPYARGLADPLQCACRSLQAITSRLSDIDRRKALGGADALICARTQSTNDVFATMSDRQVAFAYSRTLFGVVNADYVERMVEMSAAYHRAREQMRDVFVANLDLVERLGQIGSQRQLEAAAYALARTAQPRSIACYLTMQGRPPVPDTVKAMLGQAVLKSSSLNWQDPDTYEAANRAIERAALYHPKETAALLRQGHAHFARLEDDGLRSCTALDSEEQKAVIPAVARTYGFARGPTIDTDFIETITRISNSLNVIASTSGAGFERARPRSGIENLTSDFQHALATNGNDVAHKDVIQARKSLEESLILWAERILVVVNNRALLGPEAQNLGGGGLAREVAVLQSVANTIILNADDNRRRDEHAQRIRQRGQGELAAVRQVFSRTPVQTLDQLSQEVVARADKASKDAATQRARVTPAGGTIEEARKSKSDREKEAGEALTKANPLLHTAWTIAASMPKDLSVTTIIKADAQSVEKIVLALEAANDMAAILGRIDHWLGQEIGLAALKPVPAGARIGRLEATRKYLKDHGATLQTLAEPIQKPTPALLLGALKTRLDTDAAETRQYLKDLGDEVEKLGVRVKELERVEGAAQRAAQATTVREILLEVRAPVLRRAEELGIREPRAMHALLLDLLSAKMVEAGLAPEKKARFETAITALKGFTPADNIVVNTARMAGDPTQKEVTDDLLAVLRAQRVQALASGETNRAEALQAAIKSLNDQRSDLAFLRPASAYLKSVYATTSLQAEPDVGWVNMLGRNTVRAVGGGFPSEYDTEYLKTRAEIDKQFWQNINTVNLAGGGRVNYVLAKDDIGNWYVKAYSSDPSDIFRSAQGLALFGMGKKLDMNLLRRMQLQRQLDVEPSKDKRDEIRKDLDTMVAKPGAAGSDALAGVVVRYQADYAAKTKADGTELLDSVSQLGTEVRKAWGSALTGPSKDRVMNGLTPYVAQDGAMPIGVRTAATSLSTALDKEDGTATERAGAIARSYLSTLEAVRRARIQLEASIRGDLSLVQAFADEAAAASRKLQELKDAHQKLQDDKAKQDAAAAAVTSQAAVEKAAREAYESALLNREVAARQVTGLANALIADATRRRLDTVRQAETAYTILGQAAGGGP